MIIPNTKDLKTITDLREDTLGILEAIQKKSEPTVIFHRNTPRAVILSVVEYNRLMEMVDDYLDEKVAMDLEKEPYNPNDYVGEKAALKKLKIKI